MHSNGSWMSALSKPLILILLIPFFLTVLHCGKSFWEKGKENALRVLVDTSLETGEYIVFWDGKDDQKQTLPAGNYLCRLLTEEFDSEIEMEGHDGGKGISADSSGYIMSSPMHFSLEQNFPNPFYMKNGTNIPFAIPHAVHVQLTIRKKD